MMADRIRPLADKADIRPGDQARVPLHSKGKKITLKVPVGKQPKPKVKC